MLWLTWVEDSCSFHRTSSSLEGCWPKNVNTDIRPRGTHFYKHIWEQFAVHINNLEWGLANQTLVDDCPYAPQVGLGVIILGHDDLWGLREQRLRVRIQSKRALCNIVLRNASGSYFNDLSSKTRHAHTVKTHWPCTWVTHIKWQPSCCSGGTVRSQSQLRTVAWIKRHVLLSLISQTTIVRL